jgi:chemotaxis protein methyltransferase CheR
MPVPMQVFAILGQLVEERLGLHYGYEDRDLFLERVSARATEAGFDSLLDYYYFLRYDPGSAAEFDELTDALVVGETYFFRELRPLEVLVDEVLRPRLVAGAGLRVWVAACSTGEEPYTLAMLLAARGWLDRVEVLATDVSPRALARAAAGRFGRRSFRLDPEPAFAAPFLRPIPEGREVLPAVRAAVAFRRVNLLDAPAVEGLGRFDAILCRNVLIYFTPERVRETVERLERSLAPDGVLLVGVSESLLRLGTRLAVEERRGAFLYRRPA